MYEYQARVLKVVDGDTLHLDVDLGVTIRFAMTVRLYGINAPELSTPEGQAAKKALVDLIEGKAVKITTIKDRKEKYGRYLAEVFLGDTDVNHWLVGAGHAVLKDYS